MLKVAGLIFSDNLAEPDNFDGYCRGEYFDPDLIPKFRAEDKKLRCYTLEHKMRVLVTTLTRAEEANIGEIFDPDVIDIDEAAMTTGLELWNVYSKNKPNAFLHVGDPKQLYSIVISYFVSNEFAAQLQTSIFALLQMDEMPFAMFDEQHRMYVPQTS